MNHILILENNIDFLKLFLEFVPRNADITWHFAVDTREITNFNSAVRRPNLYTEIAELVGNSGLAPYTVYDGQMMMEHVMPSGLTEDQQYFWNFHSMTMKFACQLWLHKMRKIDRFLYIDDDVAVFRDPTPLFDNYPAFLQGMHFNKVANNEYYHEIQRIANYPIHADLYNQHNGCAGVMLMNGLVNHDMAQAVERFYQSEFLLNLFKEYLNLKSHKPYNKLFFADQVLMNILFAAHGYIAKPKEAVWTTGLKATKTPKGKLVVPKKVPILIHYGAGKNKQSWVDFFRGDGWKQSLINNGLHS
jgi:hypothetical protein